MMDAQTIQATLKEHKATMKRLDEADAKLAEAQANLNRQRMSNIALRQRLTGAIAMLQDVLGQSAEGAPDGLETPTGDA